MSNAKQLDMVKLAELHIQKMALEQALADTIYNHPPTSINVTVGALMQLLAIVISMAPEEYRKEAIEILLPQLIEREVKLAERNEDADHA